jgi:peptidoglycan/LPS O-acetylase OafA/YrhL
MNKVLSNRINHLDFVKGMCVLSMIIHHCINYFDPSNHFLLKYFRFVTGAFVFLSGFIVSSVYSNKYKNVFPVFKRLSIRGAKIIFIFMILNTIYLTLTLPGKDFSFSLIFISVLISGNPDVVVFELLLPIGYFLIITGFLYYILRGNLFLVSLIGNSILLFCVFRYFITIDGYNIRYFSIGYAGLLVGLLPKSIFSNKYFASIIFLLAFPFYFYLPVIPFYYPNYCIVVIFSFLFLYWIATISDRSKIFFSFISLIGSYTLFSYLFHLTFIRLLSYILSKLIIYNISLTASIILTVLINYIAVRILNSERNSNKFFDQFYRNVFS